MKDQEQSENDSGTPNLLKATPLGMQKLNLYFLLFLLVVVMAAFIYIMRIFFVPVLLALTFATLFYPLYNWLLRILGGRKNIASLLACLVLVLVLIVPIGLIVQLLTVQIIIFTRNIENQNLFPGLDVSSVGELIEDSRIFQWLERMEIDWQGGLRSLLSQLGGFLTTVINRTTAGVIGFVTNTFITLFTLFFFFRDGLTIRRQILYLSPLRAEHEDKLMERFVMISRATIKGTLLIGIIQGAIGSLTLLVFGIPTWLVWGVVMTILAIIPLLGPGMVMIPIGVIEIIGGHTGRGIAIILISILIVGTVDNLVRPWLVGQSSKMHDLMIFFSTIGGIAAFGIMGFVIGPAIAAMFVTLLTIYGTEFRAPLAAGVPLNSDRAEAQSSPEAEAPEREKSVREERGRPEEN